MEREKIVLEDNEMKEKFPFVPFIVMLYTENDTRKEYECNWPKDFILEFKNKKDSEIIISAFYVVGILQNVETLSDAIKLCRG